MARRTRRPAPTHQGVEPLRTGCPQRHEPLWAAYMNPCTVTTRRGMYLSWLPSSSASGIVPPCPDQATLRYS